MRLLTIFPLPLRGGAEEYALTIAKGARRRNWEVHAAFSHAEGTVSLLRDFRAAGVQCHELNIAQDTCIGRQTKWEHLTCLGRSLLLIRRVMPSVVHLVLPWPSLAMGTILACGFMKTPVAVVFQLAPQVIELGVNRIRAYDWARARGQQWVSVSEHNRKMLSSSFRIPSDRIARIYNGASVSAQDEVAPGEGSTHRLWLRKILGIPDNARLLTTVARLDASKGHLDLLKAAPALLKEVPAAHLVWVGEGSYRPHLEKAVRDGGLTNKVFFLGHRNDVPQILRASDLFVFPSRMEGQPFALLEAMAHGVPIVSSDTSGIPEVLTHGTHGFLYPSGDHNALLRVLLDALRQPDEMASMARSAINRVNEFSEKRMIEETMALFTRLAAQP